MQTNIPLRTVQTGIRARMWDMRSAVHNLSLEPWKWHAFQDDRDLSNLCEDQERLSNVSARLGVWPAHAS